MLDDDALRQILTTCPTVAVLGLNDDPSKAAYYVPAYLHEQGYRVIGVNPKLAGQRFFGEVVRSTLAEIGEPIDLVDVFRRSELLPMHLEDLRACKPRVVWMQLLVRNDDVAGALEAEGITVVQWRCTLADHQRLGLGRPQRPAPSLFDTHELNTRLFFPRPDRSPPPAGAVDLWVEVTDARLHVRWHRRLEAAPTVVLFHGNGEVVADYDAAAIRFASAGANLAVVDYRGYGESTGTPTLRNAIGDAPAVVTAIRQAAGAPLVVMGRSLGCACAAALYERPPEGVVGVVWESGFVDLFGLIRRRGMSPPATLAAADRDAFDPIPKLRRGTLPLLVLHGDADTVIAPAEARAAFEAVTTAHKELVYLPGRGHNDVSTTAAYWQALARFLGDLPAGAQA